MPSIDRMTKKHLYSPGKSGVHGAKFMPEFDPIFTCDSWFQRASNAVNCTLGQVATARTLFAYGYVISNLSTLTADVQILEGATVKKRIRLVSHDTLVIGYGNPRAPIHRFSALESIFINSTPATATVLVTMSWWDAEIS